MKFILPLLFYFIASSTHTATAHDIDIIKFKFTPAEITIEAGDTIRWMNKEKHQYHSVWFEQLGEPEPDYFSADEFFERTFTEVGDFPYRCGAHPKMKGIVHVIEAKKAKPKDKVLKTNKPPYTISQSRKKDILHLLRQDCGACHGMTLKGGLGPSLKPDALARLTENQVALTIMHGRPGTPMPPWKPFLTEPETQWLAHNLKQGIEENK